MFLVLLLISTMMGQFSGDLIYPEQVFAVLYGSVELPCEFSFVESLTSLTMIWVKVENKREFFLWKIQEGKEKPEEQDPRYTGRVELSKDVTKGNLLLTLRNVTYEDEGTYECRAANHKRNGNKKVTLSVDRLNARDTTVTMVTIDKKRHMKCQGSGDYHHPKVQWITSEGEDLSHYGRPNVTELSNGWKLVESVLDYDLKANEQVLCHIKEGRLKRSTRAIISDGTHSVIVHDHK